MRRITTWGLRGVRIGEAKRPGPPHHAGADLRLRHHAAGQKAKRTRDIGRGGGAWDRATSAGALPVGDRAERLLVHSVADSTASRIYLPNVRKFLEWVAKEDVVVDSLQDKDNAMSAYLCMKCYEQDVGPAAGDAALNGLVYLFPEYRGGLPRAWRCLLAWHRIHIHGEGSPLPLELLACVAEAMRSAQQLDAADGLELAVDCYLRFMEIKNLRSEDIIVLREGGLMEVTLRLGVAERGESTKTGMRQGVRVDSPHMANMLARRKAACAHSERIFKISRASYSKAWSDAGTLLGTPLGPPHSVRHSGPAHDAATGYRTLWQIQRRGRWSSERSVLRYAKTHAWVESRAKTPPLLMERGASLLAARLPRPVVAKE